MKELVIDKNTKLSKIEDKDSITKLILKTKVNPRSLKGFKNVNELEIHRYKPIVYRCGYIYNTSNFNVYNENNINELPFKNNIEKLTFVDIKNYGKDRDDNKHYMLDLYNLKSIEFVGKISEINHFYLEKCKNLETIIFNSDTISYITELRINSYLKEFIMKKDNKEYNIPILFELHSCILSSSLDHVVEYRNNGYKCNAKFENDTIFQETVLRNIENCIIKDKTIFIPDYINYVNIQHLFQIQEYDSLSLNINLLKTQTDKTNLLGEYDLKPLKKIIIRSNNEMSLFACFEIILEDDLKELFIENKTLNIVYDDKAILIDENGKKIVKEYIVKNNNKELFNDYNFDDIKEYLYYKELLELVKKYNDEEIDNAMELVGEKIIKRLTK